MNVLRWATVAVLVIPVVTGTAMLAQKPAGAPVFRSVATLVSVNVSVKRDRKPVNGLTPSDFILSDNGVKQTVDRVSFEDVPIDATVIVDLSGSTQDAWTRIRKDSERIIEELRPIDRIRILAIDTYVHEIVPMQPPTGVKLPAQTEAGGMSSVRDAVAAALISRADPERRRLVVAITDGADTKSVTEEAGLLEMARRSDSVLHLVSVPATMNYGGGPKSRTLAFARMTQVNSESDALKKAAEITGGGTHGFDGDAGNYGNPVRVFKNVFNDFKSSYVVQYSPEDVEFGGWHEIKVSVKGVDPVGIRARKGYFGVSR